MYKAYIYIETPCNKCIDFEDVHKRTKKMANGKATDLTSLQVSS